MLRRLNTKLVLAVLALDLVLVISLAAYVGINRSEARDLRDYGAAPSWQLTDQMGRQVSSEQVRGKVVVANFIYTNCPDICPLLTTQMGFLQARLREKHLLGDRVALLSFTTDPARDTVPVLRRYGDAHGADARYWRFLTGPEPEVRRIVVDGFKLGVQRVPLPAETGQAGGQGDHAEGYDVLHSKRFVLIDRAGRVRALYDGTELDADRVVTDIEALLR